MKNIFIVLALLSQCCLAQSDLNKGLKAHYTFNGNANDMSGNNNNPIFNNAVLTTDRFGNSNSAYHFNGIDQYMRIANAASLNQNNKISIAVWIRATGFYYDICHASSILSKGPASYMPGSYALRYDDALFTDGLGCSGDRLKDSLHMNFRATGTPLKAYVPFIKKGQWYSVIYTNDGNMASLYVDCELKYSIPFKEGFTNKDDLFFGKTDDQLFPFWLNADLDDIRIYDRAISKTEMTAICNEEKPKKPPTQIVKPVIAIKEKDTALEKRNNELIRQIVVDHDSLSVTLYDNGEIDGDSVTLIYNNKIVTTHQLLSAKPVNLPLK